MGIRLIIKRPAETICESGATYSRGKSEVLSPVSRSISLLFSQKPFRISLFVDWVLLVIPHPVDHASFDDGSGEFRLARNTLKFIFCSHNG